LKTKKKNIKGIQIGYSCHEEWSRMEGDEKKRNCKTCQKQVFDFSNLTREEVLDFLSNRIGTQTCGRFGKAQLKRINLALNPPRNLNFSKSLLAITAISSLMACTSQKELYQQPCEEQKSRIEILATDINPDSLNSTMIKGQIMDETGEPLIGASLFVLGTTNGTSADIDGRFEIILPKEEMNSNFIVASYIGFRSFEISLIDLKNKEAKIILADEGHLLGDVIIKYPLHLRVWNSVKKLFS